MSARSVIKFIKEILMWYVWFGKKIMPFLKHGGVILLGLIVVLSFAQNLPIPGNFKSLVVMSGSMTPKIQVGAVAIVKPSEAIQVDDIVTFKDPRDPKNLITHRIVEEKEGVFKTKGDANQAADNWEVSKNDVVGKFLFSIPLLGYAVDFAKKPPGFMLLILLPAILIIVNEIWAIKNELVKTKGQDSFILSSMKEKGTLTAAAVSAVLLGFAFSSGRTLALLSDTETSSGNTITVGVWDSVGPGDVVINEVMWMGSFSSSDDEWVELRNMTGGEIDLSGWQITKWVAGTHEELMLTIPNGKKIPAHGYFLISNFDKTTSKINVEPNLVDSSVVLVNSNLQIKLYDGVWNSGGTLIDTADDGSGAPAAGDNGSKFAMERNDTPGDGTVATNWHTCLDSSSTGLYWDAGATERGTPGAANLSENDSSVQQYIPLNSPGEPVKEESPVEEPKPESEPESKPETQPENFEDPPESSESAKPVDKVAESAEPESTPEASESAQPVEGE